MQRKQRRQQHATPDARQGPEQARAKSEDEQQHCHHRRMSLRLPSCSMEILGLEAVFFRK